MGSHIITQIRHLPLPYDVSISHSCRRLLIFPKS
jgi:hypothetical protein